MTTTYVADYYEVSGASVKTYYAIGGQRVAMREGGVLSYLLADHLGSTSVTAGESGAVVAELRYQAWGENRYTNGTTPTTHRYTGQREEASLGLYFYNARWYDPLLGRFAQPDSIVPRPGNPQSLNRYTYALNNPLRFVDPTGRFTEDELEAMGYSKQQIARWKTNDRWWALIFKARAGDALKGLDSDGRQIVIKFLGDVSSPGPGNRGAISKRTVALGIEGVTGNVDLERFDLSAHSLDLYASEQGRLVLIPTPRQFLKAPAQQLSIWYDPSAVNSEDALNDLTSIAATGAEIISQATLPEVALFARTIGAVSTLVSLNRHLSQLQVDQDPTPAIGDATSIYAPRPVSAVVSAWSLVTNLASGIRMGMR